MERIIESPVGKLKIEGDERSIMGIWLNANGIVTPGRPVGMLAELERQLDGYFAGSLKTFDLALAPKGTPFQLDVWSALAEEIPVRRDEKLQRHRENYRTRRCRARRRRRQRAESDSDRLPCHRVIGANGGSLTGFGGGLPMKKRWLLAHESGQWSMLNGLVLSVTIGHRRWTNGIAI